MIKVYTRDHCPNCLRVKKMLDMFDVEYTMLDVDVPENLEAVRASGYTSLPILEKNGKFLSGMISKEQLFKMNGDV